MTDMVVEVEKKLYKVRTKGYLSTEAADQIKQHAIDDGFSERSASSRRNDALAGRVRDSGWSALRP